MRALCLVIVIFGFFLLDTHAEPSHLLAQGHLRARRHGKKLSMMLYMDNETLPHDTPLVTNLTELPPRHPLNPLTDAQLKQPHTHEYIGMCLVTNDRPEYIVSQDKLDDSLAGEWLLHYLTLGVGKVYLFDSSTTPTMAASIAELIARRSVVYQPVPDKGKPWRQFAVYEECLKRYRRRHRWMAFFDSDEYLLLKDRSVPDLPTFLKSFEAYGGLAVNWRVVGTSGHLTRPNGSIVSLYTTCTPTHSPINIHVKTIINTRYVLGHAYNPHAFMYRDGYFVVNERQVPLSTELFSTHYGALTPGNIKTDLVVLYHYATKSVEDYTEKVTRGSINRTPYKTLERFQEMDDSCNETCTEAVEHKAFRRIPSQ